MINEIQPENVKKIQGSTENNAPTEKQLSFLKSLGYTGPAPKTKQEASTLIENIKSGAVSVEQTTDEQEEIDWCACDEPHPKFERDPNTNMHHCYDCKKPVLASKASVLLKTEVKY